VGVVPDVADHEVGEVTKLVGKGVEELMLLIDDLLSKLDVSVMLASNLHHASIGILDLDFLTAPVRTSGCGVEGLGPDDLHATSRLSKLSDPSLRDLGIELLEKALSNGVLLGVENPLCLLRWARLARARRLGGKD